MAVLFIGLGSFYLFKPRPEPTYLGKGLSVWLRGYDADGRTLDRTDITTMRVVTTHVPRYYPSNAAHLATDEAVRALNTNAVPFLLEWLQEDPPLKRKLHGLLRRQRFVTPYRPVDLERQYQALAAFYALRSCASNVIPMLIAIHEGNSNCGFRRSPELMFRIFEWFGPAGEEAIPILLRELKGNVAANRLGACSALGQIRSRPEVTVPALVELLEDKSIREAAAVSLGQYGTNARPALPRLVELRNLEPKDLNPAWDLGLRAWPNILDTAIDQIRGR